MRNIISTLILIINFSTNTTSSISNIANPFPLIKPSTASTNHLILKCKIHYLNKCDRHCNVCESDNMNITSVDTILSEVTGFSVRDVTFHNNVVRFSINNQICHFVPQETCKFFSNLETLRIWSSGLKKLDQNDIKGFENLKELILPLNDIESLNSNLFEFNKKIIKLDLNRNKLKNIGLALFSSLKVLSHVNLNYNECIDENFKNGIEKFIDEIRKLCPPTLDMLKYDVAYLIEQNENLKLAIQAKDTLIKENCDYSKFKEVHNNFNENNEEQNQGLLISQDKENQYTRHRYEEIDI